ncbi:MAG TPA: outer membrane lipoprotein carrier protein LolA [Candidatus Acidoferrum sp.]|jgi:outer membrane lipoprotein-sorting protein|nr:outer membrane lipoprotein carrier protein LolA [Candidatus Acidoferrum sp.]
MKKTCGSLAMLLALSAVVEAAGLNPMVASWLAGQTNLQSWSADFVQTRALKSLTEPLTATGQVWFAAPNRFRWELGQPAQTIAVRAPEDLLVIYPRLKRVEKFPLTGEQAGPWRDALGLLEAGFPRSQTELENQYNLLSQTVTNGAGELVLQPKSAAARRMIPQIKIDFNTNDLSLLGTELEIRDGSTLRNDFTNAVLNPRIDPQMFSPQIPGDYKLVEPLKKR